MSLTESFLPRVLSFAAVTCLFGFAAVSASASTVEVTYDFTYSGTGTYISETATGSGSFTETYTQGSSSGTLDAFTFSDTIAGADGSSMFTYNSATGSAVFSALSPYPLTNVTLQTPYVTGTNSNFGPVDFVLNFSGVTFDSTSGTTPGLSAYLGDFTSGGGTITLAATPEPATTGLLAFAALAMGLFYRSRRQTS